MLDFSISRQVNLMINLLGLFLLIHAGVNLFYNALGRQVWQVEERIEISSDATAAVTRTAKPALANNYQTIFQRNIFTAKKEAAAEAPPPEPEKDVSELEPTTLNLKLLGTVIGTEQVTMAIIIDQDERTELLYREGDSVQGAEIKKILRKKVIVSKDGKDEVLSVEEDTAAVFDRGSGRSRNQIDTMTVSRGQLQNSMRDMGRLLSDMKINPYVRNGNQAGFMVSDIANGSLFQLMGLQNGDVIQGVDGKIIRSPEDAIRMYESLKSKPSIALRILRKGVRKTLKYNFGK